MNNKIFGLIVALLMTVALPSHASFKKAIDANIKYDAEVVIYSSKECPYCERAQEYFKEKGLDYRMVDVDEDPVAEAELKQFGGTAVPVLVIDGAVLQGFVQTYVRQVLEKQGKIEPKS